MEQKLWGPLLKEILQGSGHGSIIFNIFNNDIFYCIEKCDVVHYANNDTLLKVPSSNDTVMEALKYDSKIAIEFWSSKWHDSKFIQISIYLKILFTSKTLSANFIDINDT